MFSVVVFVGDSTFKTGMPENVTCGGGYIRYIKSKTEILLSEAEVQQVIAQIADGRLKP
ncbi:NERD domain-containing protein, partial [Mariprofundus erugo]